PRLARHVAEARRTAALRVVAVEAVGQALELLRLVLRRLGAVGLLGDALVVPALVERRHVVRAVGVEVAERRAGRELGHLVAGGAVLAAAAGGDLRRDAALGRLDPVPELAG